MATFLDQLVEEKGKLKLFREDRVISLGIRLHLLLLTISFVLLLVFWQRLPLQIPLFYSRPWGESQLAAPAELLFLLFLSLLVLILNSAIILRTIEEEKFLARILAGSGLTFTFLCLVALYRIITLIT